jgi:hypothetical protein
MLRWEFFVDTSNWDGGVIILEKLDWWNKSELR